MAFETIDIETIEGGQAIRISEKLKINDDKVYLKKVGETIYLIPFHNPWAPMEESTDEFTPDFMNERNQPVQYRQSLD